MSDSAKVLLLAVGLILWPFLVGPIVPVPFAAAAISVIMGIIIFIVAILSYANH
jgi:hypothetical protein